MFRFDTFVPIHEMWKNYVKQHLKYSSKDHGGVTMSLIGADLHGAVVRVPKKGSVFILQADYWKVALLGDKLVSRSMI
ncbi:hypothetical protein AKJ16_DCAP09507 [Drosera capensis]